MGTPSITWGCDPEFFGYQREDEGKIVPAYDYPVGKKEKSTPIAGIDGWGVLADGATFEFNTTRLFDSPITMRNELYSAVDRVQEQFNVFLQYSQELVQCPIEWTEREDFNEIGCSPDQDALRHGSARPRFTAENFLMADGKPVRMAGGHLHIGIDPWPEVPKHVFVRLLDAVFESYFKKSSANRFTCMYRRAGLYRDKPYGIEYRTPGHQWITADEDAVWGFTERTEALVSLLSDPTCPEFDMMVTAYRQCNAYDQASIAMDRGNEMYWLHPEARQAIWSTLTKYIQRRDREVHERVMANLRANGPIGLRGYNPEMVAVDEVQDGE